MVLSGHTDAVWAVAFAPAGHTLPDTDAVHHPPLAVSVSLATGSSVVSTGEEKSHHGEEGAPILVSASADRTVRIWRFNPYEPGAWRWCLG